VRSYVSCQVVFWVQWVRIQSWRNWELGDWQSFRKRFAEGQCFSRSWAGEMRKTVGCWLHKGGGWGKERKWEYWVGLVYMMKSKGPRTEPWGTPQEELYKIEKVLLHLDTEGARWQVGLEPVKDRAMDVEPRRKAGKMLWSMMSKAAERSRRHRHDNCCDPIALMRWSWIYRRAVSVKWCL